MMMKMMMMCVRAVGPHEVPRGAAYLFWLHHPFHSGPCYVFFLTFSFSYEMYNFVLLFAALPEHTNSNFQ